MKKRYKLLLCAVAEYTYYCEVNDRIREYPAGVYKVIANGMGAWFPVLNRLITVSDRVWQQGPKGGVRIIKSRDWLYPMGYVTTDEKYMKEFSWVKLRAKLID